MMTKEVLFISVKFLSVLLLLGRSISNCAAVDFGEVTENPFNFHNKRVTLVAMSEVGGDRFYLFRPPKPMSPGDDRRVIYGMLSVEGPVYDRFNDKWVEVTGIIDANYRGLVSENACGLIIERVRPVGEIRAADMNGCHGSCIEMQFSRLLKDAAAYQDNCVCVVGFAHVFGDAFVIYESEKAAAKRDLTKGIFVAQKYDGPNYNGYNKRWVKITGVVDMHERGFAGHPCGIIVKRVHSAPRAK